jgi:hypothetical protein
MRRPCSCQNLAGFFPNVPVYVVYNFARESLSKSVHVPRTPHSIPQ